MRCWGRQTTFSIVLTYDNQTDHHTCWGSLGRVTFTEVTKLVEGPAASCERNVMYASGLIHGVGRNRQSVYLRSIHDWTWHLRTWAGDMDAMRRGCNSVTTSSDQHWRAARGTVSPK